MIHVHSLLFNGNGDGKFFYFISKINEIIKYETLLTFQIQIMHY